MTERLNANVSGWNSGESCNTGEGWNSGESRNADGEGWPVGDSNVVDGWPVGDSNVNDSWSNTENKEMKTEQYSDFSHSKETSEGQRDEKNWQQHGNGNRNRRGFKNQGKMRSGNTRRYDKDNNESVKITVNSSDVGRIIGKGGSKIKELERESQATIVVGKAVGNQTDVRLHGSDESKQKAKKLIEDLLKKGNSAVVEESANTGNNDPKEGFQYNGKYYKSWMDIEPEEIDFEELNRNLDREEREKWEKCPPITKNFYQEDPEITTLLPEVVDQLRKSNNNIMVQHVLSSSEPIPNPVSTFEQAFHPYPEILKEIKKQGFKKPTPIQSQAWPVILQGKDLIGIAQTGTGKTLTFLLPALIHIDGQSTPRAERGGPNVLILAPTRELALQIENEARKFSYKGIRSVCVYGGGDRKYQVKTVQEGVEIIIATPGRMNDLIDSDVFNVLSVTFLILDEADKMLDMGFELQIRRVLKNVRPDKQIVLTSATWPPGVRKLAESLTKDPIQIIIGSLDLSATHSVTQHIEIIPEESKDCYLEKFINSMKEHDKVVIFVGKKTKVNDLVFNLKAQGVNCDSIHGEREQYQREQALEDLKSGEIKILVATDLASRGLDICDITHIINYDFPKNIEEYVHRIGRTGRAGKTGLAYSYFTKQDWGNARKLIKILEEANQTKDFYGLYRVTPDGYAISEVVPSELIKIADKFEAMMQRKEEERESSNDVRGRGKEKRSWRGGGGRKYCY